MSLQRLVDLQDALEEILLSLLQSKIGSKIFIQTYLPPQGKRRIHPTLDLKVLNTFLWIEKFHMEFTGQSLLTSI